MFTLGLTGGIGSGKSCVSRIFASLGARIFDADREAKSLMEQDSEIRRELTEAFGPEAFDRDGRLNRALLAERVFADEANVTRINQIVHPRVHRALDQARAEAEREGVDVLVHEAALIFESGSDRLLDAVAVVDAPVETRIARVMARDGVTREQVLSRMRHQLPPEELRARADYVIDNSGSLPALRPAVEHLYADVATRRPSRDSQ